MPENQFDQFINASLKDHPAPVPDGLWDRLMDKQFDQFVGQSLRHHRETVPETVWDKISDAQLDQFIETNISNYIAPVPSTVWDHITDAQFDHFVGQSLQNYEVPVQEEVWDKVADSQFDQFFGSQLNELTAPVPTGVWDKVNDHQFDEFFGTQLNEYTAPVPAGAWDSINDRQFDQFVGDQLNNYTAPVPESLWEKIQPQEKEDRRIIYWFRIPAAAAIIVALLLGGSFAAYYWIKNLPSNQQPAVIKHNKEQGTHSSVTKDLQTTQDSIKAIDPSVNNQAVPSTAAPESAIPQGPTVNSNNIILPLKKVTGKNLPNADKSISTDAASTEQHATTEQASGGGNRSGSGFIAHFNHKSMGKSGKNYLPADNKQVAKNESVLTSNNSLVNNEISNGIIPENFYQYEPPYISNYQPAFTIPTALNQPNFLLSDKEALDAKHASQFKSNVICPTNRSNVNTDWLLELYTSPDFAFKSVSNISATQQYLQKKDSSEKMQISYTAGFRLVKPINDNFLVKTGLQYSQINEKYVYRSENEIKTTTVVTVRTIIRAPGDTVVVSDTSTLQTIGFKNNVVKNRFRSIDIPVLLGYQFGQGDFKFGINAGVIFNVSSWYQGVILDSTLAVVPLTNNNMVYKRSIGLGLYAGFSISKQLGDDMQIFCEPYFRYNLSNMTNEQAKYNQKFSVGGLSIGLRFNLNRN